MTYQKCLKGNDISKDIFENVYIDTIIKFDKI